MQTQPMTISDVRSLAERLYPICRSITGDGVRQTLSIMDEHVPIAVTELPTGTEILDWTVPKEWNVRSAWIEGPDGEKIVDMADLNLHVMGYSTPVDTTLPLDELQAHLHSLPDRPGLVPFVASYYSPAWGFCLSHERREGLEDGEYRVHIDSSLEPGSLTYGEHVIPGVSDREILISAHVDHPALANENVSGLAVAVAAATRLADRDLHHTVRFVFAPATVGAIAWLAENRERVDRIAGGFTITSLGDSAPLRWKATAPGDATIDRIARGVLADRSHELIDFYPFGYDERQYNSPGFRLPIGSLMRAIHGEWPEYHTSGDNLDLLDDGQLAEAIDVVVELVLAMDETRSYVNQAPHGEPQLGRRGIYDAVGGKNIPDLQLAMLWVLNRSDGAHDLASIAGRSGLSFDVIDAAAELLLEHGLIR